MYYVILAIQILGILGAAGETLYVVKQRASRQQQILLILVISILINFVGYTLEMTRTNMNEALLAVKFLYFGKPYVILCLFFFVLEVCQIQIKKGIRYVLIGFHILVTTLVFTCEYNTLFYTSVSYTQEGIFPHLLLGHGVVYMIYIATSLVYVFYITFVSVRALLSSKNEQERTTYKRLMSICVVSFVAYAFYFLGMTGGYDSTLLAYLYGTFVISRMFFREHLLDTLVFAKEMALDTMSEGLLVVNITDKIVYFNEKTKQLFPDLEEGEGAYILDELDEYILQQENMNKDNNVYSITARLLQKGTSYLGKMYIITDISDNYYYTRNVVEQTKIMKKLKDRAEEANHDKTLRISEMAQEIQKPLDTIRTGALELMQEREEENRREELEQIGDSAEILWKEVKTLVEYVEKS